MSIKSTSLMFVHAYSPLHAGTGQSTGAIDLSIAREKATGMPYIPGSSIKGVLRDVFEKDSAIAEKTKNIFGPDAENAAESSGSVYFGDARLLLLPIRSFSGTFAYVTSPYILGRFIRDLREAGNTTNLKVNFTMTQEECFVSANSALNKATADNKVILEDLDFASKTSNDLTEIAKEISKLTGVVGIEERLVVVHDNIMSFLSEQGTEVTARIRLDDDVKTVVEGALWYEEHLPAETVLSGLLCETNLADGEAKKLLQNKTQKLVQLGGKSTVGRGMSKVIIA